MEKYFRTDLAAELINDKNNLPEGIEYKEEFSDYGFLSERLTVLVNAAKNFGKPAGDYLTVNCGNIAELDAEEFGSLSDLISKELMRYSENVTDLCLSGDFRVLVVGLGNEKMTPDAIGPECVSRLGITRQLKNSHPELFEKIGCCSVSAFTPGAMGQTGIETSELVLGAVRCAKPNIVIAVDALAARSAERLGSTVQLSTAGINPGSGVGNRRKGLNEKNHGVPVIALGVPTVVDSTTLIRETLEKSGMTKMTDALVSVLENRKNYFVAPKECDALVKSAARLLASSINSAFGISFGEYA